ncbi:hypothetical protein U1Q18_022614, partial [Sarracenia purpurea var. burkii]
KVDPTRNSTAVKLSSAPLFHRIAICDPETGYRLELLVFPNGLPNFYHLIGVGSELVVIGRCDQVSWHVSNSVFIFNFVSFTWRCGGDMPGGKRLFFGSASDSDRTVFVVGGHDEDKNALKSVISYVVAVDAWVPLLDMVRERDECKGIFRLC